MDDHLGSWWRHDEHVSHNDDGASYEDLVRRVGDLETENARLRLLLGFDTRAADGHETAWTPTLLVEPSDNLRIDATATDAEKLKLLWALFGARSDVYATRWENSSTGKSGWSPAARGAWSRNPAKDYLPLADDVFLRHLRGALSVGIYPLLPGDVCALLACDFDQGSWALDSLAYLDACNANGVPAALERSRSGNGAHVWVFFDAPVAASQARAVGAALLRQAMTTRAELNLASYDRFFPSQDFLPKAGFGNLIALPLQGDAALRGSTVFLDPTTMQPWPDQWAFLSSVARMSTDAVTALADSLRPVNAGPALTLAELSKAGGPAPPAVIHARLDAMLSIERAGLPPAVIAALKHLGSIANPEFYEKQRMRFSTWDTPRFITAYREDLEWLQLPRGLSERVAQLVEQLGSRLDVIDDRPTPEPAGFRFVGRLREQQAAAVAELIGHEVGVLVAPPGAGKTVMACAAIAHHDVPTLVVVDRKELIDQWRSRLGEHLGLATSDIGQIGGGKDKPTGVVDVAMIQSLARRDDASVFDAYGFVVVDECHHLPAVSFANCVQAARSRRWLGLTATPYRRDKLEALIGFQCGPTRHEIKPGDVDGTELVRRELIVHNTTTEVPTTRRRYTRCSRHSSTMTVEPSRSATTSTPPSPRGAHASSSPSAPTTSTRSSNTSPPSVAPHSYSAAASARRHARASPLRYPDATRAKASFLSPPAPTLVRDSTGPNSTHCSSRSRSPSKDASSNTSGVSCAPTKANTTSNSTTTSTFAYQSSTACTPNASPRTPCWASMSQRPDDEPNSEHNHRHPARRPMRSDDDLDALIEHITVDAYCAEGYDAFLQVFEDKIDLPFPATRAGMPRGLRRHGAGLVRVRR